MNANSILSGQVLADLQALLLRSLLVACVTPPSAEGGFVRRFEARLQAMPSCCGKPTTGYSFFTVAIV